MFAQLNQLPQQMPMPLPDIEDLSIPELKQLITKCDIRIRKLAIAEEKAALEQMREAFDKLKALGKSAEELPEGQREAFEAFNELEQKHAPPKSTAGRPKGTQVLGNPNDKGDPLNAKYFNSNSGDWHSGFGPAKHWPDWLTKETKPRFKISEEERDKLIESGKLKRKG